MPAVAKVGVQLDTAKAVAQLNKLNAAAGKVSKSTGSASAAAAKAGQGFKLFGAGASAASVGVKGLGAAIGAALGPITAVVAAAASLGEVFNVLRQQDFAEKKFESLGGNSKVLKQNLEDVSRELSGQASVVELTAAAYDVASAGFINAADASKVLKAASLGATGGFSDINTVGDATTSVLNAYGLSADKASKLVDGFIQTQNDGKIVIAEYAANIAKVAPVAAALSVPLEEVNAAVAQITAGGQGAEVTFTALKTAFAQIAAGKVGKEFEKLGVEISASTLKSDGLAGTLQKIEKSGADAGTVIKAFGTEAGPAILALLNDTEKYNKLLQNQKEAQGAAAAAAFTAADTIDGQLKRLTTAFQNLFADQSELGVVIKQTFKVAAVTVETLGAAINLLFAPTRAFIALASEIGEAIAEALGLKGVNAAFQLEQGFQFVLKTVSQVGDFIIGLGRLIGQEVGKRVTQVIDAAKTVRKFLIDAFSGVFDRIAGFVDSAYKKIPEPIRKIIEGALSFIGGQVKGAISGIGAFVSDTVALGAGVTDALGANGAQDQQQPVPDAVNNITPTGGKVKQQKTKKSEYQQQLEAAQKLLINLERQTELAAALTSEERNLIQLKFDKLDIDKQFPKLSDKQKQTLRDQLQTLFDQKVTTKELIQQDKDRADALKKAQEEEAKRAEKLQGIYDSIGSTIADGVVNAINAAVDKTKSLAEVAMDTLNNIAQMLLRLGINTLLQSTGLSIFTNLPGFARGGRPPRNRPSIVGEAGPELFVPRTSGTVIPNGQFGGGSNIVVNVDASGSSAEGNAPNARALGKAIGAAVQSELIKQKRPGGLLA